MMSQNLDFDISNRSYSTLQIVLKFVFNLILKSFQLILIFSRSYSSRSSSSRSRSRSSSRSSRSSSRSSRSRSSRSRSISRPKRKGGNKFGLRRGAGALGAMQGPAGANKGAGTEAGNDKVSYDYPLLRKVT